MTRTLTHTPGTGFHCVGKEGFPSYNTAKSAARNMSRHGKGVDAFQCPTCRKFHLGRSRPARLSGGMGGPRPRP